MKRNKKKIIKFLEIEDVKKLEQPIVDRTKNAIEHEKENKLTTTDKIVIRDFALISLVYACALRISEACELKLANLNLEEKIAYIEDSKGDDRVVPIPKPIIPAIEKWLAVRPNWKGNKYVFTNVKGTTRPGINGNARPLNQKYYNQLFDKMAEQTGVTLRDGSVPHPHTLRHSRAMELYDANTDLEVLQAFLGHKNISTTQVYAVVRDERVIEAQQNVVKGLVTI